MSSQQTQQQTEQTNETQEPVVEQTTTEECQKTDENKCQNSQISDDKKLHSLLDKVPRWLRIILSVALLVAAYKWFPVLEILQVFCFVVIIPLVILTLIGFVTRDTYNSIVEAMDTVKEKVVTETKKAATV